MADTDNDAQTESGTESENETGSSTEGETGSETGSEEASSSHNKSAVVNGKNSGKAEANGSSAANNRAQQVSAAAGGGGGGDAADSKEKDGDSEESDDSGDSGETGSTESESDSNDKDDLDDEDDEDEDGTESESSGEDDTEPQLKYQRLGGDVTDMVHRDSATCFASHSKLLVLGMASGSIFIIDPAGDIVKRYQPHPNRRINQVSIDTNGDYVASCSQDGKVVIRDIYKDVQTIHNFHHQDLLAVELHPEYGTQNQFVTGGRGQQLLLRTIGFFRSDNKVLHSGEGPIYTIAWRKNLIAWANDRGVKLYDITDHKPIAHINRSLKGSPDPERYKCCLCWEDDETLLIGWGDWVKIGRIRTARTPQGHFVKEVHVTSVFITDFFICGIAPFKEHLVLLAFNEGDNDSDDESEEDSQESDTNNAAGANDEHDHKSDTMTKNGMNGMNGMSGTKRRGGRSKPPELRIVSRRGQWIATDALPIKGFKNNEACDYRLVWSFDHELEAAQQQQQQAKQAKGGKDANSSAMDAKNGGDGSGQSKYVQHKDETFYIVSPKDIVAALPRTIEDHIKWLWERKAYEEAWREAVRHSDELARSKLNPTVLGQEYLKWVLREDPASHKRFAQLCYDVCQQDKELWENWVNLLAGKGKLQLIIAKVPTQNPQLSKQCYELILHNLMKSTDHRKFLECIREWDPNIYNMQTILNTATNHLNEIRQSDFLVQALAELYRRSNEYDKALEYYLQLTGQLLVYIPEHFDIIDKLRIERKTRVNPTIDAMIKDYDEKKRVAEEKEEAAIRERKRKLEENVKNNPNSKAAQQLLKSERDKELKRKKQRDHEQKTKRVIRDELEHIQADVFSMIKMHELFDHMKGKVLALVELDLSRAIDLFAENVEFIHPTFVVQQVKSKMEELDIKKSRNQARLGARGGNAQMQGSSQGMQQGGRRKTRIAPDEYKQYLRYFLYCYLNTLVGHGDGSDYPEFHDELVSLYALFDTTQLLQFLNLSNHVTFPKALSICQSRLGSSDDAVKNSLYECIVFILHRMGNFSEALQVILVKLKNVRKAVQYVEKQHDKSLWNQLIDRTLTDAKQLMPELLDAVKGHPFVDTQELIQKIPNDLVIPSLRNKIIAIFEENSREKSLTAGTTNILRSDCMKLANRLKREANRGIVVNQLNRKQTCVCTVCNIPLSVYPSFYRQQEARTNQLMSQKLQQGQNNTQMKFGSRMLSSAKNGLSRMSLRNIRMGGRASDQAGTGGSMVRESSDGANSDPYSPILQQVSENASLPPLERAQSRLGGNLPLWQLTELSNSVPPVRVFFCGHYYHLDCMRQAQEKEMIQDQTKCPRCFSAMGKK